MKLRGILLMIIISLFLSACAFKQQVQRNPEAYLSQNPDLTPDIKNAILEGVVIEGMCPNEAMAAAGRPGVYYVKKDPKWENGTYPPYIIQAQCENPDSSIIELNFYNTTQYKSKKARPFMVRFEYGKVVLIEAK